MPIPGTNLAHLMMLSTVKSTGEKGSETERRERKEEGTVAADNAPASDVITAKGGEKWRGGQTEAQSGKPLQLFAK